MGQIKIPQAYAESENYPPVCMICAKQETNNFQKQEFTYFPPWLVIFALCGLIPAIILLFFLQKKANVNMRICNECLPHNKRLPTWSCLLAMSCTLLLIFSIYCFSVHNNILGIVGLIAVIIGPMVYYVLYHNKWLATCVKIDNKEIILNLPNSNYPRIYEEYLKNH